MSYDNGGMIYLRNPARKYKHMRNMVRHLFDMGVWPQFDIDGRFGYSVDAITDWLLDRVQSDVNEAHNRAMADYSQKTRGRPPLARNKNKVMAENVTQSISTSVLDEILPSDTDNDNSSVTPPTSNDNTSAPAPSMLDSNKFVLKTEFDKFKEENTRRIDQTVFGYHDKIANLNLRLEDFRDGMDANIEELRTEIRNMRPTIVVVQPIDLPQIELGVQHKTFPKLLALCNAAILDNSEPLNVWLHGPAGTGKTTAAKEVAKSLTKIHGREFKFYALSKLSTEFQVLGYKEGSGRYVSTLFRDCYENGGVIILDEMDSWSSNASTALNGALANGYCAFPDKMVARHPDCVIIAGANTTGLGATIEYVGRNRLDAATMNRFEMLNWPIDEALEAHLTNNDAWLARVRHIRKNVALKGLAKDILITPRAAIKGAARLRQGIDWELCEELFLRQGMSDAQWKSVQ